MVSTGGGRSDDVGRGDAGRGDVIRGGEAVARRGESAATFPDCPRSRILLDRAARQNGWHGYRTLLLFLSYFLQEDSLVLL